MIKVERVEGDADLHFRDLQIVGVFALFACALCAYRKMSSQIQMIPNQACKLQCRLREFTFCLCLAALNLNLSLQACSEYQVQYGI